MKFDVIDVLDADVMEDGAWLHLLSPADGEPLYRDPEKKTKPCRALVRSEQSSTHRNSIFAETQRLQGRVNRAKKADRDRIAREVTELTFALRFADSLIALENATTEQSGVVQIVREDALKMGVEPKWQWLTAQVLQFSGNYANFAKSGEEAPPPPAPAGGRAKGLPKP